jgi:hypothetical protein
MPAIREPLLLGAHLFKASAFKPGLMATYSRWLLCKQRPM